MECPHLVRVTLSALVRRLFSSAMGVGGARSSMLYGRESMYWLGGCVCMWCSQRKERIINVPI